MPDTDPLREAALAATPGRWVDGGGEVVDDHDYAIAVCYDEMERRGNSQQNAAYIALASPDRVLALLDEVALLRAALDMIAHPVAHGYPDPQDRATLAHWMTRVARLALSGAEMDRLALVAGSGR